MPARIRDMMRKPQICNVEIKATQGNSVSLRSGPDRLLVFLLLRDGSVEEI